MGLWRNITGWLLPQSKQVTSRRGTGSDTVRRCQFEVMEQRQVLSANPVVVGVTYHEMDGGQDVNPDRFEVTFQGGSATTQLASLTIHGDQDQSGGVSRGDMVFHGSSTIAGGGNWHAFKFDAVNSVGVSANDIESVVLGTDGLNLTVNLKNFAAGDRLVFTIDVDEVESFRFDPIASGVEFEGSLLTATFVDPHFNFAPKTVNATAVIEGFSQSQTGGTFYDYYDQLVGNGSAMAGSTLSLWQDDHGGMGNRSAATVAAFDLTPKPITISGHVYHDLNINLQADAGENGIGGVTIKLQRWNETQGNYVDVAQTTTDSAGAYEFGADLNLSPGRYRVVELQPNGFLNVGAVPGEVSGTASGNLANDGGGQPNVLTNIEIPLGDMHGVNYDFFEVRPSSISGYVTVNVDGNCTYNPAVGDQRIAGITLRLLDSQGQLIATTQTDSQGHYEFAGLMPGTYSVVQVQPQAYLDGAAHVGTINGSKVGMSSTNRVSGIVVGSGQNGVEYNFCEHVPASICGYVYHDRNNDGIKGTGEEGIGQTVVRLYDANGTLIAETLTDSDGKYCFMDLKAGSYSVQEVQPNGWVDGKDTLGTVNGLAVGAMNGNDGMQQIQVLGGQAAVNFNFGELKLASLSGYVYEDPNGNQILDVTAGDKPLSGVTLQLLNAAGNLIATTSTDANGFYRFDNLLPGTYSVRELQPQGYFTAGQTVGRYAGGGVGPGSAATTDLLSEIVIRSGQNLVQYDFQEVAPAELAGRVWVDGPSFRTSDGSLPTDYRSQRDGLYQAGVDTPLAGVRMRLYFFIDPSNGEIAPRPVTLADVLPGHYDHLGSDPNAAIWVMTDANGNYRFSGLPAGNYVVLQEQPGGVFDANEIAGSTTGFVFNSTGQASLAPSFLLQTFSVSQVMDSIVNVRVNYGGVSVQNNFTEVVAEMLPPTQPPPTNPLPPPITPPRIPNPTPPGSPLAYYGNLSGALNPLVFPGVNRAAYFRTAAGDAYTWHLSVINAGTPRAAAQENVESRSQWLQASFLNASDWARFEMDQSTWVFATIVNGNAKTLAETAHFGPIDGVPLAGDFSGDGKHEIAVFHEGYFMIDLNGNGTWDESDLLARLGDLNDQPVIGDWDGDGKADIGIFGRIWPGDLEAIAREPGLPNPENFPFTRPKNVPPAEVEGAQGARVMRLTSHGNPRADLIDHVFGIEHGRIVPLAGDWNGNGIRSIGTFEGGQWRLDVNGDGHYNELDKLVNFGQAGDLPIVGDFDGDGVEQIGVYRNGTWIVDSNSNLREDREDLTFVFGTSDDVPVVGDWTADGKADIGLYRPTDQARP